MGRRLLVAGKKKYRELIVYRKNKAEKQPDNPYAQYNLALTLHQTDPSAAKFEWKKYLLMAEDLPDQEEWVEKAQGYLSRLEKESSGTRSTDILGL